MSSFIRFVFVVFFICIFTCTFAVDFKITSGDGEPVWDFIPMNKAAGSLDVKDDTLKVSFDFSEGDYSSHVAFHRAVKNLKSPPKSMKFKIYKTSPHRMGARLSDESGETFQKMFDVPVLNKWVDVELSYDSFGGFWGGDENGRFDGAATGIGFAVEKGGTFGGRGDVFIKDIKMVCEDDFKSVSSTEYIIDDFTSSKFHPFGFGMGICDFSDNNIKVSLPDGGSLAGLRGDIEIFGEPKALKLKINTPVEGLTLNMKLASHFVEFFRNFSDLPKGEQVVEIPVSVNMEGWEYTGTQFNGVLPGPLRVLEIRFLSDAPFEGNIGVSELSADTVMKSDRLITLASRARSEEDLGVFKTEITNLLPEDLTGDLVLDIFDFEGNLLETLKKPIYVSAKGGQTEKVFYYPMNGRVFLEGKFSIENKGILYGNQAVCAVKPVENIINYGDDPDSVFGMGVYLYRYRNPENDYGDMRKIASLAEKIGVKWTREEFSWAAIEKSRGNFEWDFYDKMVDVAQKHHISVYGLLCYWNDLITPDTEEGRQAYYNYVKETVTRYKGKIRYWEVWNEPNIFFFPGPKENYVEMLKKSYDVIKSVDPDAVVLGCATSGIDGNFINMCIDKGGIFDILSVHPYRPALDDKGFQKELRDIAEVTKRLDGKIKPVWITEMGWGTQLYTGVSEREQASFIARSYIDTASLDFMKNLTWYDLRDDGNNRFYGEHNLGIMKYDYSPKPAYRALGEVIKNLGNAKFIKEINLGEDILGFEYSVNNNIFAVWSRKAGVFKADFREKDLKITNLMGEKVPFIHLGKDKILFELKENTPVFVKGSHIGKMKKIGVEIPEYLQEKEIIDMSEIFKVEKTDNLKIKIERLPASWEIEGNKVKIPAVNSVSYEIIQASFESEGKKITSNYVIKVLPGVIKL